MLTDGPSTGAVGLLRLQGGLHSNSASWNQHCSAVLNMFGGTLWLQEIPTWVAQPLPPEHPDHGWAVCLVSAAISMHAGMYSTMHAGLQQCSVHACCGGVAGRLVLCRLGGSVPQMPAPSLPRLVLHSSSAADPSTCAATLCSTGRTRCCSGSRR